MTFFRCPGAILARVLVRAEFLDRLTARYMLYCAQEVTMTRILPQLEVALNCFPLVQEACGSLGLNCNVDNIPPADTGNPGYVVYTKAGEKFQLQIGAKFRLTVLDDHRRSCEEKLDILIKRLRAESWSKSPVIIL